MPLAKAASIAPQTTFEPATVATFSPPRARERDRHFAGLQLRAGDDGGERVEDVMLGLLDHLRRQRAPLRLAQIRAELGHDRADRLGCRDSPDRKRRGDGSPHQVAPGHGWRLSQAFVRIGFTTAANSAYAVDSGRK